MTIETTIACSGREEKTSSIVEGILHYSGEKVAVVDAVNIAVPVFKYGHSSPHDITNPRAEMLHSADRILLHGSAFWGNY